MRLSLGLEARQVQVQKLAPRMIQSMEILQLPILALQERIEQEMNENPVLELPKSEPEPAEEEPAEERENPDAPDETEKELVVDETKDNADDFERLVELDREVPDYFDESPRRSANRLDEEADRKHDAMANIASRPEIAAGLSAASAGRTGTGPGREAHGRADHLLPGRRRRRLLPHDPAGPAAAGRHAGPVAAGPGGPAGRPVARSAGRRRPRSARVPAAAAAAGHALLRGDAGR